MSTTVKLPATVEGRLLMVLPRSRADDPGLKRLEAQAGVVVCMRKQHKECKHHGDGRLYSYHLVEAYHTQDGIKQQIFADLGEFSDLGEISALEIALEDAESRLAAEQIHQQFQEKEFARGWHRSGHLLDRTQHYTPEYMARERAKTATQIARLRKQIRRLEGIIVRFPTPPDMLTTLRGIYRKVRAEALQEFEAWEAKVVASMAKKNRSSGFH